MLYQLYLILQNRKFTCLPAIESRSARESQIGTTRISLDVLTAEKCNLLDSLLKFEVFNTEKKQSNIYTNVLEKLYLTREAYKDYVKAKFGLGEQEVKVRQNT